MSMSATTTSFSVWLRHLAATGRRLVSHARGGSAGLGAKGSIAIPMLLALLVMAVPVVVGSLKITSTLATSSHIYERLLSERYAASDGVENTFYQLLRVPAFDDLTVIAPTKQFTIQSGSQQVDVTLTKIFSGDGMEGQGLDIHKTVNPTTATPGIPTTYTYTIALDNIGSGQSHLDRVRDLLGPGFTYVPGSVTGLTTAEPQMATVTGDPGRADQVMYLNEAGAVPYPWEKIRGGTAMQSSYTPTRGTWETIPEYWEASFPAGGQIASGTWKQTQWWYTTDNNNWWRWKAQRVSGSVVTDLWTSDDKKIVPKDTWVNSFINHSAPIASLAADDKLRLRLEVYSNEPDAANRRFDYRWGGNSLYDSNTRRPGFVQADCEPVYTQLTWVLEPSVVMEPMQELTLSFQATATKPDGTYYNQAWARYNPWWGDAETEVFTPPTAPIIVGTGEPRCGGIMVTKAVSYIPVPPGQPNTYTFTISMENMTPLYVPLQDIYDLLPPGFTYIPGTSSAFWPLDPTIDWMPVPQRYQLDWKLSGAAGLKAGQTALLTFQTTATLQTGYDYSNEAWVEWRTWDCETCPLGGDLSYSGPSAQSTTALMYDAKAVAGQTEIDTRFLIWDAAKTVDILSWQVK